MKRTERTIITDHLEIRIVSETPEAEDLAKWQERAAKKAIDANAIDEGGAAAIVAGMRGMVGAGLAAQAFPPPQEERYLLIRKTGLEAGAFARVDAHEARLLMHLLQELGGAYSHGLPRL